MESSLYPPPQQEHTRTPPPPHDGEHAIPTDLPRIGTLAMALMALAFVALLGCLFMLGWQPRRQHEALLHEDVPDARPVVSLVVPTRAASSAELTLPADVRAMQETAIYPRANGYLKRLLVDIGDRVKAGDLLAEIDAPDLDAELSQARASLQQAKANALKAKADMELASSTVVRFKELAAKDLVSAQQMEEKESAESQSKSAYAAAEATVTASQAAVERLATLQGFQKITAPFAGIVTARNYDVGALLSSSNVSSGREMFRLNQTDTLRIFVDVPQAYSTMLRKGLPAHLIVRNYPGRKFTGTVERWSGALDSTTRTLRCEIHLPNADNALYPGMYGQVIFPLPNANPPLLIPTAALMNSAAGLQVAVVEDDHVKLQSVTIGRDLGTKVEVVQGLQDGQQVVANPDERLTDGTEVKVAGSR